MSENRAQLPRLSGSAVKLWHDDVRMPPDGSWIWAITNEAAILVLRSEKVAEISLDYDLGGHAIDPKHPDAIYVKGHSPDGSELDLVHWMLVRGCVPSTITIHSWNPAGAARMAAALADAGHPCVVRPFEVPRAS